MNSLITFLRRRTLQGFWKQLHHASLVLMNYWASHLRYSGEVDFLAEVARSLPPDAVLFDVGANVGDFTEQLLAHSSAATLIHAFEPSTTAFSAMQSRLGDQPRAKLHRIALSDRPGRRTLHADAFGSSIGSLETLASPIRAFDPKFDEEVECTTIDDYCREQQIRRIDLLKIDVEGHELKVLTGAKAMLERGCIDVIQWEFGENNISSRTYLRDFVDLLEGFEFYRVVPGGLVRWTYRGGESEIFATMNYVAIRKGRTLDEHGTGGVR